MAFYDIGVRCAFTIDGILEDVDMGIWGLFSLYVNEGSFRFVLLRMRFVVS